MKTRVGFLNIKEVSKIIGFSNKTEKKDKQ